MDTGVPWRRGAEAESTSAMLATQAQRAARRGPAQQPRLAEADRGLEETDARRRLGEQLGEQRFAGEFHLPPR